MSQNIDEKITSSDVALNSQENLGFDIQNQEKKDQRKKIIIKVVVYVLLTFMAILSIFPFYWMIITSLKTTPEYEATVPTMFPHTIDFSNYADAFSYSNNLFVETLINSLVVGILSTAIGLIMTIIGAYAFAKMQFKGKNFVFTLMLMTMMIPGELFTTTNFITTTRDFGWSDTYTIMILPFLVSIYYIYLLRNAFLQIPDTLYKAAKVDGCSDAKYLIKVMVPLSAPTIVSITILKLIGTWNSYMWPQLVNSSEWRLVSNWMASCGITSDGTDYPMKMAAALIVSIPLFIVFLFFRKYIMKGVSKSGIKG